MPVPEQHSENAGGRNGTSAVPPAPPAGFVARAKAALGRHSLTEYLVGLWFSRRLTRHGWIVVSGGRPRPKVINQGGQIIVDNVQFYSGVRLEIGKQGTLKIGKGTYLNRNTVVVAEELVEIGSNCRISWDVTIMDSDLHPLHDNFMDNRPVIIEDNVWIGCHSIILKGVRVGAGAVIAAGAVVTKDIPPNSIAGGVPARVLALRTQENRESFNETR